MKYKDISGQKFGRLVALYKLHNYNKTGSYWLCCCGCGNLAEVYLGSLRSGATNSCGCLHTEKMKAHRRLYRDKWYIEKAFGIGG